MRHTTLTVSSDVCCDGATAGWDDASEEPSPPLAAAAAADPAVGDAGPGRSIDWANGSAALVARRPAWAVPGDVVRGDITVAACFDDDM